MVQTDVKVIQPNEDIQLGYAALTLLDDLGIEAIGPEPDAFGLLVDRYGIDFPDTRELSQFARNTLDNIDPLVSPDHALVAWMDHEQALFHYMERHIVKTRLQNGFAGGNDAIDVDGFFKFATSVVNRRKSRAGSALGHHVEAVLNAHGVRYVREARTENSKRPDFLFPGQAEYNNLAYPSAMLTMLGAKRTCKDRWRQVLSEANRIVNKHLLTLEPSISIPQTNEMRAANLQLVVPHHLFASYQPEQRDWLMDVAGFIELVKSKR